MAEAVAIIIGLLFFLLGAWILALRISGIRDLIHPHTLVVGEMRVDGSESKAYAELMRARFDHHFRRPASLPSETGFIEAATLDTADLFQPTATVEGNVQDVKMEVSGVDVAALVKLVNFLAAPDQWLLEGDFQSHSDRSLLALRLRRGDQVVRTWYLERYSNAAGEKGGASKDQSVLLEGLVDDAIFQVVYDFVNPKETNPDLRKWRDLIKDPPPFPSATALAAYFEAQGALGRYYASGDWHELDAAVGHLRDLQAQMPEFDKGLRLLGMALAEQRSDSEAIHVYEQLESVLTRRIATEPARQAEEDQRLLWSIALWKATATAKLGDWHYTHEAIGILTPLAAAIRAERGQRGLDWPAGDPLAQPPSAEELAQARGRAEDCRKQGALGNDKAGCERLGQQASYGELLAQTQAQLAHCYSQYLDYLGRSTVGEVFTDPAAPKDLQITDPAQIQTLKTGHAPVEVRRIVIGLVTRVRQHYEDALTDAQRESVQLDRSGGWWIWEDGERRRTELAARMKIAEGYASFQMAEWESVPTDPKAPAPTAIFGEPFETRLRQAIAALRAADAAHPNNYAVLQLLGQVYAEPRSREMDLSIAEQYFERSVRAKPSDNYGHELLADVRLKRAMDRGVDASSREALQAALGEADLALQFRPNSGTAYLLRAQIRGLLYEIERDPAQKTQLQQDLARDIQQAGRLLHKTINGAEDPDLTWLRINQEARTDGAKPVVIQHLKDLIGTCDDLQRRWVNQRRVAEILPLRERASALLQQIQKAPETKWREADVGLY